MKKILTILCCLLAPALMANSVVNHREHVMPAEVYEALLVVNGQHDNSNMTFDQAQEVVKGIIVLEVGTQTCSACNKMYGTIKESSLPAKWEKKGVHFYHVDYENDSAKSGPRLIDWMREQYGIRSVPVLLVIKNGQVVARRLGFNMKDKISFIENLERVTLQS